MSIKKNLKMYRVVSNHIKLCAKISRTSLVGESPVMEEEASLTM
jgi:hypothetical protein